MTVCPAFTFTEVTVPETLKFTFDCLRGLSVPSKATVIVCVPLVAWTVRLLDAVVAVLGFSRNQVPTPTPASTTMASPRTSHFLPDMRRRPLGFAGACGFSGAVELSGACGFSVVIGAFSSGRAAHTEDAKAMTCAESCAYLWFSCVAASGRRRRG